MSKNTLALLTMATLSFSSFNSLADMTLDKSVSSLNFISSKNEHIAEQHSFDRFTGMIDEKGKLLITIDMTSVNTLIPIRNERMQSLLFNVEKYTSATFSAQLSPKMLSLKSGEILKATIVGEMSIAGTTAPVSFDVSLVGLLNDRIQASTNKPTLISTSTFQLDDGIDALQKIAMLQSISKSVPLSFNVTFSK